MEAIENLVVSIVSLFAIAIHIAFLVVLTVLVAGRLPVIEGDKVVLSGDAYVFPIGDS
ncbi:hypothetical protein GCM10007052_37030 [Halioglobus japonicus]|nr:hypothetical protein GCM10007052_37030 [Halioglobus japonicus]